MLLHEGTEQFILLHRAVRLWSAQQQSRRPPCCRFYSAWISLLCCQDVDHAQALVAKEINIIFNAPSSEVVRFSWSGPLLQRQQGYSKSCKLPDQLVEKPQPRINFTISGSSLIQANGYFRKAWMFGSSKYTDIASRRSCDQVTLSYNELECRFCRPVSIHRGEEKLSTAFHPQTDGQSEILIIWLGQIWSAPLLNHPTATECVASSVSRTRARSFYTI